MQQPQTLAFVLPHLRPGGAEMAVVRWLSVLDRGQFTPIVFLKRREGALLDRLPADVAAIEIGGRRAAGFALRLRRALDRYGVDIAYSATSAANLSLTSASLLPGRAVRIFVSEHTTPEAFASEAKWPLARRILTRHLYRRSVAALSPTSEICAALGRTVPGLKTGVVPNPVVDQSALEARGTRTFRDGEPCKILAAGRLVPAKGFDLLVEVAAMLKERSVPFRLTICGEGPLRSSLEAHIAAKGLENTITLAGYCADLEQKMCEADLFVLSSRREGFGNVIVEAMAAGCPVVSVTLPGPAALIRDGETGLLVEPGNPAYLADAIQRLAGDPQLATKLADAAQKQTQPYDIAASAEILAASLKGQF